MQWPIVGGKTTFESLDRDHRCRICLKAEQPWAGESTRKTPRLGPASIPTVSHSLLPECNVQVCSNLPLL
jgi:hypothetical protein